MLAALLITFRETIEATLIVATVLGILTKLNLHKNIKIVWFATISALALSIALLLGASLIGVRMQEMYSGAVEEFIEGSLMIISAIFITWAVFFLHSFFAQYKVQLLGKVESTVSKGSVLALFVLIFTAVFREGFEVVLFLGTLYFSSSTVSIGAGALIGILLGLVFSGALFRTTISFPVYQAFRISSLLLILFAAGLLAQGIHEFAEIGIVPELLTLQSPLLPSSEAVTGVLIKTIFGITKEMDITQILLYLLYAVPMLWWAFVKSSRVHQ